MCATLFSSKTLSDDNYDIDDNDSDNDDNDDDNDHVLHHQIDLSCVRHSVLLEDFVQLGRDPNGDLPPLTFEQVSRILIVGFSKLE